MVDSLARTCMDAVGFFHGELCGRALCIFIVLTRAPKSFGLAEAQWSTYESAKMENMK